MLPILFALFALWRPIHVEPTTKEAQHCSAVARPWLSTLPKSKRKRRSSALRHHEAQGVHRATSNHGTSSDSSDLPDARSSQAQFLEQKDLDPTWGPRPAALGPWAVPSHPTTPALGKDLHWNLVTLVVRRIMMALWGLSNVNLWLFTTWQHAGQISSNHIKSHGTFSRTGCCTCPSIQREQWQKGCALVAIAHPFQITSQYLQRGPRIHEQIKYYSGSPVDFCISNIYRGCRDISLPGRTWLEVSHQQWGPIIGKQFPETPDVTWCFLFCFFFCKVSEASLI